MALKNEALFRKTALDVARLDCRPFERASVEGENVPVDALGDLPTSQLSKIQRYRVVLETHVNHRDELLKEIRRRPLASA